MPVKTFDCISSILWANDETAYNHHMNLARRVRAQVAAGHFPEAFQPENAAKFLLADRLKDLYGDYIDDVRVLSVGYKRSMTDNPHAENLYRQSCIQAMVRYAWENTDWHEFADTVLGFLDDADRHATPTSESA